MPSTILFKRILYFIININFLFKEYLEKNTNDIQVNFGRKKIKIYKINF